MWSSVLCLGLAFLASHAQALYFYIDGPSQKCFFEELPKDTLVVGMRYRLHLLRSEHMTDTMPRPLQSDAMERAIPQLPAKP